MVSPGAGLSAVAIVGPTAVGKSDVADRLAARLSSEVLSCDAMQIYRGMDIGTAKMAPDECAAPLRLVDIVAVSYTHLDVYKRQFGQCMVGVWLVFGKVGCL